MVAGHGAGDLLRAACQALLAPEVRARSRTAAGPRDEVPIAWPGWGPLPRLVHEAGGRPVPVPLGPAGIPDADALLAASGERTGFVALCSPNDPTGGEVDAAALRRLAERLPEGTWIVLDAALAEFGEADLAPLAAELDRLLVFHSFSKAFAMAGFRAGYAVGPPDARELLDRLAPVAGVSAPAQAGMAWAVEHAQRFLPRPPRGGGGVARAAGGGAGRQLTRLPGGLRAAGLALLGLRGGPGARPPTSPRAGSTSRTAGDTARACGPDRLGADGARGGPRR